MARAVQSISIRSQESFYLTRVCCTIPQHAPEQIGAAERLDRAPSWRVRAMLKDSGLPKQL